MWLIALLVVAPNIRPLDPYPSKSPYPTDIVTDRFEVVDISFEKKMVAFRHVYHLSEPPGEEEDVEESTPLKNCNYMGFEALPYSGMTYGIYDLAKDQLKSVYTVYRSTFTKCTTAEESKQVLLDARKAIMAVGLDPDAKIKAVALPLPAKGVQDFTLTVGAKKEHFRASTLWHDSDEKPRTRCGSEEGVSLGQIERSGDKQPFWFRCQHDVYYEMSGGTFIYPFAVVKGAQVVFAEQFRHFTQDRSERDREIWSFSRVLPLK